MLALSIRQMGSDVAGAFSDWNAQITFADDPAQERNGSVRVEVTIASLRLGSVTGQAMGADFFDEATHPRAVFEADILRADEGYVADGTLSIKGNAVPVRLPFALTLNGDQADMAGSVTLDRRDFGIGGSVSEAGTLAFEVDISVALSAQRVASAD
jgi:polyisoprenoid-binding protein YceI